MLAEGHLLVLLHAPPGPDQEDREPRVFWRLPDGNWKSNFGKGRGALAQHIAEYHQRLDEAEQMADNAADAEGYFEALELIAPLRRAARNMHAALQQAREFVADEPLLISRRDDAYGVERTADLLHDDVKNAFELYVARQTEAMTRSGHEMAVAGHRLNTLAALFLPMATLGAVLGMNLPSGLETVAPPVPFFLAVVAGVFMGLVVKVWLGTR